jgi:hypothetical protein
VRESRNTQSIGLRFRTLLTVGEARVLFHHEVFAPAR